MTSAAKHPSVPWSAEAEQALLGGVLLDNRVVHRIADLGVVAEHFYNAAHGRIWTATLALIGAGSPADVITVNDALGPDADACGGLPYLLDLSSSVGSGSSARRYAEIVITWARRRALALAADKVKAIVSEQGEPADQLDRAQSVLSALARQDAKSAPVSLAEAMTARSERWEALGQGQVSAGMRTRLPGLDKALGGGLQGGRVVVIAARPSIGKTSLAVQIGLNVAGDGHRVLVLSQEMPRGDLTDRIAANLGRVRLDTLAAGIKPGDDESWSRAAEALERASQIPIEIDDQPALSLVAIRSKAQMVKAQRGLGVLIVDYLQLCAPSDKRLSRHHQIEEISRGLKTLAKELDICVLLLSQINRDVAKSDREPTLADLKESGAIEEDADVVLLLHPRRELDGGALLIAGIVAKNRQGPKPRVGLRFEGVYQRWGECDADVTEAKSQAARRQSDTGL